jgi:hypothetical protein
MDKQSYFDKAYDLAKQKGYEARKALEIANRAASDFVPQPQPETVEGTRTMAVDNSFVEDGNFIDVLVGYPDSMLEEGLDDSLDNSGWDSFSALKTKADMEHYSHDTGAGIPNNLEEEWRHFLVDAEMYKKGNEVRAKVSVPESEQGQKFKEMLTSGQLGASIEYRGKKNGNKVTDWEIKGFSFTKNPHYNKTK